MDLIFGTKNNMEILKTKGKTHSMLSGFQQTEREYPDQTVKDSFRVVKKLRSAEDSAGNCYDWYEINGHYRTSDRSKQSEDALRQLSDAVENSYDSLFDELKYVADRDDPISLKLPMIVRRNLIYRYEGKLYVALKNGIADEKSFDEFFAED